MRVMIFGATGMVGQGVLRECLLDDGVEAVLSIGRAATGRTHAKLREIVHADLYDLSSIAGELAGWDACFFCLGVSSAGMSEADYRRVTYDLTLSVARTLLERDPGMTFVYVSGASTDSTEKGRVMWARVKGKTENDLLALPFKASIMFRPGIIQPLHGVRSKTGVYRAAYAVLSPLFPVVKAMAPGLVTTSEALGRAMIRAARDGVDERVLETTDINRIAAG
jgi:uncharacterized protein YbjT (DUF2867 family)